MPEPYKRSRPTLIAVLIFGCLYLLYFTCIGILRYHSFDYYDMDLAVYSQMLWNITHGSLYSSIMDVNIFGHHAHFILLLIAPLYLLIQHPLTLVFLQALALAAGLYPVFLIARQELGTPLALAVAFTYILYPALGYTNNYEFHVTAFSVPLLSFMLYFFIRNNLGAFLLFMSLSLMCQENISLVIFSVGIYAMFRRRRWPWIAAPVLSGVLWFLLVAGKLMPYLNKGTVQFISIYSHLGSSLPEIARFIITNPAKVGALLFTRSHMMNIVRLFAPLCFLPALSPEVLMIFPALMQHFLSNRPMESNIYYHYTAEMIPFIFFSAVYGIKRVLRIRFIKRPLGTSAIIPVIVIAAVASNVWLGPQLKPSFYGKQLIADRWDAEKERLLDMIPHEASVVATLEFLARLSTRRGLYSFHHVTTGLHTLSDKPFVLPDNTEYALLNFNDLISYRELYASRDMVSNIRDFMRGREWGAVDMVGSIVLLKKDYASKLTLYSAGGNVAQISNITNAVVSGDLELTGYRKEKGWDNRGDLIRLTFFWRGLRDTRKEYANFIDIVDSSGETRYKYFKFICYKIYPTYLWHNSDIIKEDYILLIPKGLGYNYSIRMGFFDLRNGIRYKASSPVAGVVDEKGRIELI